MNRVISFYMWIGSLLLYFFLLAVFLIVPVRSTLLGELSSDQVIGTLLILLSFGPLCYLWLRFCNHNLSIMENKWLLPVALAPFIVSILGSGLVSLF